MEWKGNDIALLQRLCDGTRTIREVTAHFPDRSFESVRAHYYYFKRKHGYELRLRREYDPPTERRDVIAEGIAMGLSYPRIADRLGISSEAVSAYARKEMGITRERRKVWTDDKLARLRLLWNTDLPRKEIAKRLHVSEYSITNIYTQLKIKGQPLPSKWQARKEYINKKKNEKEDSDNL